MGFPSLYPYVQTKPLHETQILKKSDADGYEIEIEVRPNYELEQLILSYGDGMAVLTPTALREKIKTKLESSLKITIPFTKNEHIFINFAL